MHLMVIDIDDVGLIIVHRRDDFGRQGATDTTESLGRTLDEHLTTIGRECAAKKETILIDERVECHGLKVEPIERNELMGTQGTLHLGRFAQWTEDVFVFGKQRITAVLADVVEVTVAETESDWTHHATGDIVNTQCIAVAPTRLAILGIEHLIHVLVDLLGALLVDKEDEGLLVGRKGEIALGQMTA